MLFKKYAAKLASPLCRLADTLRLLVSHVGIITDRVVFNRYSCAPVWIDGRSHQPAKKMREAYAVGRAEYCRQQAALCREVAAQLSLLADAERLRENARAYDSEADRIDAASERDPRENQ